MKLPDVLPQESFRDYIDRMKLEGFDFQRAEKNWDRNYLLNRIENAGSLDSLKYALIDFFKEHM